ncbi:Gfo/Idh/MocA family protein [Pseudoalteromonas obscura]|uniref:Gfo/Idh/MocA family oxidoreductase n=1 Tax=Pseudoalteromonas obscura TaxID=3048491 RepID=A0ABT7ER95_9GAMM|nr:Gfo/Idh/MocA family oxidoreductase [Pseudoalteromonas sp. P94(2023)]MDK2597585.1 Gfo/Idh/MocA family oxidoreductase [Pseudoalteromonas sp. P94(2023)]
MINNAIVIGLGSIAKRHRKNIKQLYPDSTVFAMSASGRVPNETIEYCDKVISSFNELNLESVQLAIVASPAPWHAAHAIPLIESRIPTIIEKPVAASSVDVAQILKSQKKFDTQVAVGYCLRFLPSIDTIKSYLKSDKLGEVQSAFVEIGQYLPDWRSDKNYKDSVSASSKLGGGALLELSHEIDYAIMLFGGLSVEHATLKSSKELGLKVEDCADILTTTSDHTSVHIHLDFLQRKPNRVCKIIGSNGTLFWDLIRNEVTYSDGNTTEVLFSEPEWDKNQMYIHMIEDFLSKEKCSSLATLEESLKVVELIEVVKNNFPIFIR